MQLALKRLNIVGSVTGTLKVSFLLTHLLHFQRY